MKKNRIKDYIALSKYSSQVRLFQNCKIKSVALIVQKDFGIKIDSLQAPSSTKRHELLKCSWHQRDIWSGYVT